MPKRKKAATKKRVKQTAVRASGAGKGAGKAVSKPLKFRYSNLSVSVVGGDLPCVMPKNPDTVHVLETTCTITAGQRLVVVRADESLDLQLLLDELQRGPAAAKTKVAVIAGSRDERTKMGNAMAAIAAPESER